MSARPDKARTVKTPHASKRAAKRLGIEADIETIRAWSQLIDAGSARFLWRQSRDVSAWEVRWGELRFPLIYHEPSRNIVTVLPIGETSPPLHRKSPMTQADIHRKIRKGEWP